MAGLPLRIELTEMSSLLQDLRFAVRQLRKNPGFAAVSILTLALGIGASTIIFSVVYNGVLYPFPYRSAERLTAIEIQDLENGDRGSRGMYHLDEVAAFRNGNHTFEDILAYGLFPSLVYTRRNVSEMLHGVKAVLGTTIMLNGKTRTIIGVMPPRFQAVGSDVYMPVSWTRLEPARGKFEWDVDDPLYFWATGILKRDVSFETAAADIDVIARQLSSIHAGEYPKNFRVSMKWLK